MRRNSSAGNFLLDAVDIGDDRVQRLVVVFFARHREQFAGVAQAVADAVQGQHDVLQRPLFAAKFLRALGVVPDLRVFELALDGL
jgi:hypothetical protein